MTNHDQPEILDVYEIDLSDAQQVVRFPHDFSEWLKNRGYISAQRRFLSDLYDYFSSRSEQDYDVVEIAGIAARYVEIIDTSNVPFDHNPFIADKDLTPRDSYRPSEEDPLEADTPLPQGGRVTPVKMWITPRMSIYEIVRNAVGLLRCEGYPITVREIGDGLKDLFRSEPNLVNRDVLEYLDQFLEIVPLRHAPGEPPPRPRRIRIPA